MNKNQEIIKLAKEIIDDVELRRASAGDLVSKASRLASLVNDSSIKEWLNYEKYGFSNTASSINLMKKTGRTYNEQTKIGMWGSIYTQEMLIDNALAELEVIKSFKPSGTYSALQFQNQLQQVKTLNLSINTYRRICTIVTSSIQDFASKIYYSYKFGQKADSLIKKYQETTLKAIIKYFPELKESLEVIENNSSGANSRQRSAAGLECRNILINLSNKLWKNNQKEYKCRDGQTIKIQNEKNKLIAYVDIKMGNTNEGKAKAKKLFGVIHEVFALGGKSKRNIHETELSTTIIDIYVFLNDLATYTDLKPLKRV